MTKKPKKVFEGFQTIDEEEITLQPQTTPRLPTVINYRGKRYRMFSLEGLDDMWRQQAIYHSLDLIINLKFEHFRWKNELWVECREHPCRLECVDCGGHWVGTGPIENRKWVTGPRTTK
jgi:hypothetical protein